MFQFLNPEDLPPEMLEHIKQHQDQADMSAESYSNSVHHFFDSLDAEQLRTLNLMLHQIVGGTGSVLAAFYEGQVQMMMKHKHNVCPVHGVNHEEEELADMLKVPDEPKAESLEPHSDDAEADRQANLARFNLTEVINPETDLPQYVCKCGQVYVSLEDRMLKDEDDCPGCIHKAQWG